MIKRTTATLECAAQVRAAAITMQKTGSWVTAARTDPDQWRLFGGRQGIYKNVQREQRKAEADRNPAERSRDSLTSCAKSD